MTEKEQTSCGVETRIGTIVVETPRRVYNPVTDEYRDLTNLSEDGYCRRFLALKSHVNSVNTVELDSSPVLTFDKDRWKLDEQDGQFVLVKREAESRFGERILGDSADAKHEEAGSDE